MISLPKEGGKEMKEELKNIAYSEHRTVSNKAFMILQEWVRDNTEQDRAENYDEESRY